MTATLVTLLAINAASTKNGHHFVFWVTLPAAFVMFCWDVGFGWYHRHETRDIARKGRQAFEVARAEQAIREEDAKRQELGQAETVAPRVPALLISETSGGPSHLVGPALESSDLPGLGISEKGTDLHHSPSSMSVASLPERAQEGAISSTELDEKQQEIEFNRRIMQEIALRQERGRPTLVSRSADAYRWTQETFPTVTAVMAHLPFALVPFAFAMFVLVQALVTKGWVPVFAFGWDHWVDKTGTVGSIAGMGFLSVVLCNVSICPFPLQFCTN
jgi:uncharacterized membrane protein